MALSDLSVFSEYAYESLTEVLAQQVDLFNEASNGCIRLSVAAHQGDYSDMVFFGKVAGLVRRRNAYGSASLSEKVLGQKDWIKVKVAAGTPPVRLDPSQWRWIQMDPATAGAAMGQQIAKETLADMLNTSVGAAAGAIQNANVGSGITGNLVYDITAQSKTTVNPIAQVNTTQLFGDYSSAIEAWVMHSKPMGDLWVDALTQTSSAFLFNYGTVAVKEDPFGRRFVISDIPNLVISGSPNEYMSLALVPEAIVCEQNSDFDDNYQTINGNENIKRTYQAEWSYELGIKGYAWDKTNGGHSPTDAALMTGSNWDAIMTSIKDSAGLMLLSK